MLKDQVVEQVRKAREQHASHFGFELKAILADARNRQSETGRRVVSAPIHRKKAA